MVQTGRMYRLRCGNVSVGIDNGVGLQRDPFSALCGWLDFWDFLVSNNIMPIGSILLAVFCCYKVGWGWDKFLEEANEGKGLKVQHWMKPVFKYFVPAAVLFIYVYGMVNFAWK